MHALYGFARHADDILDDLNSGLPTDVRAERLQQLSERFFTGGDNRDDPVLAAVTHTARRYGIASELFDDFLASMRMDLTVTDYPDRASLNRYMKGSAEAIGLQMLPVLGTAGSAERPSRTPRRWAPPSSSPTSSATSPRTWVAGACTCPPTNWPSTASTGTC